MTRLTLTPRLAAILDGHASREEADHCLVCEVKYGPTCQPAAGYGLRLCAACAKALRPGPAEQVHRLAVLKAFSRAARIPRRRPFKFMVNGATRSVEELLTAKVTRSVDELLTAADRHVANRTQTRT
jgi:hypothetical protein